MHNLNGHTNTRRSKNHVQHVGSEPQCAVGQYIILTAKITKLDSSHNAIPVIAALPTVI